MPKAQGKAVTLSPRHLLFCQEYVKNGGNGKLAAMDAGYKESAAHVTASRLLNGDNDLSKQIAAKIDQIRRRNEKNAELSQAAWMRQLWKIAMADMTDFVQWDERGRIRLTASTNVDGTLLQEVSETITEGGGTKKVKLSDRMKAFDMIARAQGYYEKSKDGPGGGNGLLEQLVNAVQQSVEALDGGEDDE